MPRNIFNKSANSQLYLYSDTGAPVPGATYTVAFLQDPAKTVFPASYTITQSWGDPKGTYLFYNGVPSDEPIFVNKVRNYLSSGNLKDTRFLWIQDCNALATEWVTANIAVTGSGGKQTVAEFTRINFSNYSLCIGRGAAIVASGMGTFYTGFIIVQSGTTGFSLDTGSGVSPLSGFGNIISIPLEGCGIGALEFYLTVAKSTNSAPDTELGSLNAGMKFFYIDDTYQEGYLADLHYPFIDPSVEAINFYPSLDPINPLIPQRTYFGFLPPGSAAPQQFPSYYRTWVGRQVNLTPKTGGGAKLVFAPRPQYLGDPSPPYYLTPCGAFVISIPSLTGGTTTSSSTESETATRIMCGVSPVEYVGYIKPTSGTVSNLLTFYPGQNAYSPSFSASATGRNSGHETGLKGDATTSYVTFTPDGPSTINYYSQPNESVFYDPSVFAPTADPNFLDFKEIITKPLADAEDDAMPMVPLAGLAGYPNPLLNAQFEIKAINQARRGIVQSGAANAPHVPASTPVSRATTRHGLLGFFGTQTAGTLPLIKVQLAQSDNGTNTITLAGPNGGDITGVLKSALQSNQLFLVISNKTNFENQGAFLSSLLTIAGIPFNLDPAKWQENNTIIVYKYANGSINQMAADLGSWCYPAEFTDGGLTQMELLDIIKGIISNKDDPNFQQVYDAVTNSNWNGILAFNVEVNLADMPGQLAGIAAGIDPAQFKAHHLGMNLSPMVVTNEVLTMQDTALFGLINYVDATPFQDVTSDYGFKVSMLKILFGNSQIKDFACKIDLMVNSLFGSGVVLDTDGRTKSSQESLYSQNVVELNGYYQGAACGNSFSFSTNRDLKFKAASMVLDQVEFFNADYVTENPDAAPDASGIKHIRTHFSFTGLIRFHEVEGFDCFSFGDTTDATPVTGGLAFSNLTIHMDYDLDAYGNSSNRTFVFDAQNLSIDVAASKARPQSLYNHFPLKFKNFIQGKSGSTPIGLGYLGVSTPASESGLMYPWFGLQYELNLGTLGALAGSAGFTATLLFAWSPAPGYSMFTGIKIPGTSPQSLSFSVEGLLGLSIDNIRFLSDRTPQGNSSYTLVFNNLAVRLFGLKIPQSAYVDMVLFGNPDPSKKASSLGWFAAWNNS